MLTTSHTHAGRGRKRENVTVNNVRGEGGKNVCIQGYIPTN